MVFIHKSGTFFNATTYLIQNGDEVLGKRIGVSKIKIAIHLKNNLIKDKPIFEYCSAWIQLNLTIITLFRISFVLFPRLGTESFAFH